MKLSNDMQLLSEIIGVDKTIDVIVNLSGISLYIPNPDFQVIRFIHQKLGGRPKDTARHLGITERKVYRAIESIKEDDGQLTIFDAIAQYERQKQEV